MSAKPILNADDYGISTGVSRSIRELAAAGRLSATSAMTNMPAWSGEAAALRPLRERIAVGLHVNLTAGAPLADLPRFAPAGRFPGLPELLKGSLLGRLDRRELEIEIERQFDAFETWFGHPPDHVDGHQHAHALPTVRDALIDCVARRYASRPPLIRVPIAAMASLARLGATGMKGAFVGLVSRGFKERAGDAGLPVNDAFAGFSGFDMRTPYSAELVRALDDRSVVSARRAIIMCHPGFPDAELAAVDPILERRAQEHESILGFADLPARIWHADRAAQDPIPDWAGVAV